MNALTGLATGRPRRVLAVAGIVFLLAAALGGPVAGVLKGRSNDFHDLHDQSLRTQAAIQRATGQSPDYGVAAVVKSAGDTRRDSEAQRLTARVATLLATQKGFQRVLDYPSSHLAQLISRDGRESVVLAAFATQEESARAVDRVRPQLAGSGVRFGGQDVAFEEINHRTSSDLEHAELFAFPILLLLSLWVFRGLVAAMLPLLVGGFAIVLAFVVLRLVNQFAGLSIFAVNLVTGVGLGLGIDYSLFILSRYREELAAGKEPRAAIGRTLQTAGRTVLYGSLTVAGALASMLVFPERFLYSMGVGGMTVALMAGGVSLVVLPAVLIALGPRIDALAPKWMQRGTARAATAGDEGGWARLARAVTRRPGKVALLTALALLAVASPALRLALTPADARVLPTSSETRQVSDVLARDFHVDGSQTITMVLPGAGASGQVAVQALAGRAQQIAATQAQVAPPRHLGQGTWEVDLLPQGSGASTANQALVKRLRAFVNPQGGLVGGPTAGFIDQKSSIASHVPLVLAILAVVTCGFLFLMTGSALMPLMALAMNLLTVAVGAGLLVLVFQDGHFSSLLGFTPIGGLEEANLVLLFVIAFALSTDYGVFLFGRIKEAHDHGLPKPSDTRLPRSPAREAIVYGLERTGRLVTAAALLFCVAIGAFATSHVLFVQQLGVGAALAVAIDATVVRALLVPALMGRLGEWAWWAPLPLRKLHTRFGLREGKREGSAAIGVLES
ncbi:MAG TPA: MMPL family transporter [Solirubrobacteraceae bacterium]|jgi:RND superfamily putative drug exporter|nr:MMPL family transporter [Solirubrobacteraceae bacterium]